MANLTNLNNKFLVTTGGDVGINTTSPGCALQVTGAAHFGTDSAVVNPSSGQVVIETGAGNSTSLLMYTYGASIFEIQSDGATAQIGWGSSQARTVNFTNTGAGSIAVGIDTTSPTEKLHVVGNTYISGVGNKLLFDTTGALGSNGIKTINDYETVIFNDRGSAGFAVIGNANIRLGFGTNYTNAETDLYINTSGNVGIGTTNPSNKLTVSEGTDQHGIELAPGTLSYIQAYDRATSDYGDLKIDAETIQFGTNNGTERMRIDSSGQVGIGTASPSYKLDVYHATTNVVSRFESGDNQVWIELHDDGSGSYGALLGHDSDAGHLFAVADENVTKQFVIEDSADVGIGTDSPNFRLDIVNAAASTATYMQFRNGTTGTGSGDGTVMGIDADGDFLINNQEAKEIKLYTSDSQRLTIQSGGNVGIGTTSPSFLLHVAGDQDILKIEGSGASGPQLRTFDSSTASDGDIFGLIDMAFKDSAGNETIGNRIKSVVNDVTNGTEDTSLEFFTLKDGNSTKALTLDYLQNAIFTAKVGIGKTNPSTDLDVQGVITAGDSTTDGAIRRQHQTFATMKPGPSSGSGVDMIFVDHTHTLDITVFAIIDVSNVATARGYSVAAYGSATASLTQTQLLGNISALSISYVNTGGSENYVLRVTCTYSGASAPEICVTATGQSASELRAAT